MGRRFGARKAAATTLKATGYNQGMEKRIYEGTTYRVFLSAEKSKLACAHRNWTIEDWEKKCYLTLSFFIYAAILTW